MTARDVLAFGERPLARIPLPVGNTPVVSLRIRVDGRAATLRLKLESFNPCGSMKDRTAVSLYESVAKEVDPVWHVPVSIQEEQRRAGKIHI